MSQFRSISRRLSVCSVMQEITNCGPISRASISKQTGLSKQTVSEIVARLETDGWVRETGRTAGHVGRTAATYELVATAAFIATVDLGGTKVRVALADLSCTVLAEVDEPTDSRGGIHVIRQIGRLCRGTAMANRIPLERMRFATVGVPGAPDAATGRILMAPNIAGIDEIDFAGELEAELGVGVQVDNDVNLAVLGENWAGCASDVEDVVFISLGTGIGAGVLINGKLVRGAAGAAGEVAFLPFGADPFDPANRTVGAFERFAGSLGMRQRYQDLTGAACPVPEIFARAARNEQPAVKVLDDTADAIARLVAAIGALLDPSLVVIGGSIGQQKALYDRIVAAVPNCFPRPIRVEQSALKHHAALVGGAAVGLTHLHQTLFAQGLEGMEVALPAPAINLETGSGVMAEAALIGKLAKAQDREADLALLGRAVGRESITGNEANVVGLLHDEMDARGLSPIEEPFQPGRPNIWGERKGRGGGPRLQFIGHTDTVHVRGWREKWAGTEREDPFGCAAVDGHVWGRGVGDLKGGICASLAALDLLDRAGIPLKGDVAYAFVGDEESGEEGSGVSAGVDHWSKKVSAGAIERPDFAIYVEPTNLSVYVAQIGFFIADVTVTGKSAYFGRPELGIDALKATHAILQSVWGYAGRLETGKPHELTGGSSILVTSIEAGGYIAVPGEARFSVIGTLRPGDDLDSVVDGFEKAVHGAAVAEGISVSIRYPAGRDHAHGGSAVEIDRDLPPVALLTEAIGETAQGKGAIGGAPYWSEMPFLVNRLGCPTVYCAPGDISNCHTLEERLEIEEYLAAVRAYALFMTRFCGVAAD